MTLQDTCLAVLLLQACDKSEIVSNFQFGVQVPENCEIEGEGGLGKVDLVNSVVYKYVPSTNVYSLNELNLNFAVLTSA